MFDKPPDVVPDGLTAEENYKLGQWYHSDKQLDNARIVLMRAVDMDQDGQWGTMARIFLGAHIPKNAVPAEAIKTMHELQFRGLTNPQGVRKELVGLTETYPNFEWPYKRLAELELQKGLVEEAVPLLQKALEINPDYGEAMGTMARVMAADMQYGKAVRYLRQALQYLPEDRELLGLRRVLEIVIAIDG